jgi:hypothetical protein
LRNTIERRLQTHAAGEWQGIAALLSELNDGAAKSLVTQAASDPNPIKNAEEILKGSAQKKGLITILREKYIEQQLAVLTQRLVVPETSEAERLHLLHQQQELRQLKRQPLG